MSHRLALASLILATALGAGCSADPPTAAPGPAPSATPTPSGRLVSLAEAAAAVPYRLASLPESELTGKLEAVYVETGVGANPEAGPAVEFVFPDDLTFTVDPTLKQYDPKNYPMSHGVIIVPEVKGDPTEEPRWALRTVRDRTAVGLEPTDDHHGMVSWAERDVFLTLQSPVHSLEELLEMAETVTYASS
jgi:hypothetical protein